MQTLLNSNICNKLLHANTSMQLALHFNIRYIQQIPKGFGMEKGLTQITDKISCDNYTGRDAMEKNATETYTMIYILRVYDYD